MKMNFRKLFLVGLLCWGLIVSANTISAQRKMMQIKGSDTLVNLAQILAEAYMTKNPRSPIAVLGGGSGTGIAALINGTCDIANHSRPMKEKEIKMAKDNGVTPYTFVIAVDGLSVIVNGDNPISQLTMEQIGAMFRGEIRNWKEVGGQDKSISLYGRQSNSGTYVFFQEHVLGKQNYSAHMKRMNGNAQIVEGVSVDKFGIGYVGVGYVVDAKGNVKKGIKILKVSKDANSTAYSPLNKASVDSGDYPIARGLYQSTAGVPKGAVLDFLKFELSSEGQKIVEEEGFFPIGSKYQEENTEKLK
jgi:phosphate transport system substrate-binding protein